MCLVIDREITRKMKKKNRQYFYFWKVVNKVEGKYYSPFRGILIHKDKVNIAKGKLRICSCNEINGGVFHAYAVRQAAREKIDDIDSETVIKVKVKKGHVRYFGTDRDVCFTKFMIVPQ